MFLATSQHTAIVKRATSALTNLGAAKFWLRLLRLISFPPCAEATSLKAMKKPYKKGKRARQITVLYTHQYPHSQEIYREIQRYPPIQIAFSLWICQIPNLRKQKKKQFRCYWLDSLDRASLRQTFPRVLSDSPDFLRNWAASPADILPVFPGSSYKGSVT